MEKYPNKGMDSGPRCLARALKKRCAERSAANVSGPAAPPANGFHFTATNTGHGAQQCGETTEPRTQQYGFHFTTTHTQRGETTSSALASTIQAPAKCYEWTHFPIARYPRSGPLLALRAPGRDQSPHASKGPLRA